MAYRERSYFFVTNSQFEEIIQSQILFKCSIRRIGTGFSIFAGCCDL